MRVLLRCVGVFVLVTGPVRAQEPEQIALLPTYTEGVEFDGDGNVYVSETYSDTVSKVTPAGVLTAWARTGAPNGHKVLPNGEHLVCDTSHKAVLLLDANGSVLKKAATKCGSFPIRAPNDLTLDSNGGFYFSDPGVYPDSWEESVGRVCYVGSDGASSVVVDGLAYPNGIVLRPGGSQLLVGESKSEQVVEYDISRPGVVGASRVLARHFVDGMTVDEDGDLYIANGRSGDVVVVDRSGKIVRRIPTGIGFVSNVAVAGSPAEWLYVPGSLNEWTASAMDEVKRSGVLARVPFTR